MNLRHIIFGCFATVLAFGVWGCSSSSPTSSGPTSTSGTLSIATPIDFGNTRVGVCADTLLGSPRDTNIAIKNTSASAVKISSVMSASPLFSVEWYDTTIAPDSTGSMELKFCPAQTGIASTTLTLLSNAAQDSSVTITVNGNGVPYSPGTGSTFNYAEFATDTNGKTIGSQSNFYDTVIASGLSYQGGSNVSESSDSEYYILTANGDDSLYVSGFTTYPSTLYFGGGWQVLPFATQTPNTYSYNEVYVNDSDGETITLNIHDTARYIGMTNMTVGNVSYPTSHVYLIENGVYSDNAGTRIIDVKVDFYYSPDLHAIVNQTRIGTNDATATDGKKADVGAGTKINLVSFHEQ